MHYLIIGLLLFRPRGVEVLLLRDFPEMFQKDRLFMQAQPAGICVKGLDFMVSQVPHRTPHLSAQGDVLQTFLQKFHLNFRNGEGFFLRFQSGRPDLFSEFQFFIYFRPIDGAYGPSSSPVSQHAVMR